jgi:hypothetical protein
MHLGPEAKPRPPLDFSSKQNALVPASSGWNATTARADGQGLSLR